MRQTERERANYDASPLESQGYIVTRTNGWKDERTDRCWVDSRRSRSDIVPRDTDALIRRCYRW